MKKLFLLILLTLASYLLAQDEGKPELFVVRDIPENAENILRQAEQYESFLHTDISTRVTIEFTDPQKGTSVDVYRFFRRDADDYFLMLQEKPESKLGSGYLQTAEGRWFYDPESRQFFHRAPYQTIGKSDASTRDVQASSLLRNYRIIAVEEAQLGAIETFLFTLEATNNEVSRAFKRIWIAKEPHLILKEEGYSLTHRLLNTRYTPLYAEIEGRYIAEHIILVSNTVQGRITKITLEDISLAPLPDTIFSKAYVERVNR